MGGKRSGRAPDENKRAEALSLYMSGLNLRQVGDRLGITHQGVKYLLSKTDVKMRKRGGGPELDIVKAVDMRVDGMLLRDISDQLHVGLGRIGRELKAFKGPDRKQPPNPFPMCPMCREQKPRDQFYILPSRRSSYCKICTKEYRRRYHQDRISQRDL